jgi:hypothetical protein
MRKKLKSAGHSSNSKSLCHSRLKSFGSPVLFGRFFMVAYSFFMASELIT